MIKLQHHNRVMRNSFLALLSFALGAAGAFAQTIEFLPGPYSVDENAGTASVIVTRSPSTGSASVNYQTVALSASPGSDYLSTNGVLSFSNGESYKIINISILEDAITEPSETFQVNLSGASGAALGALSSVTVSIQDNDSKVRFESTGFFVNENGITASVTVARDGVDGSASVEVTASNGTAGAGDYIGGTTNLVFTNGQATAVCIIPIVNDCLAEQNETINLSLANPIGAQLNSPTNATLTILDEDSAEGTLDFTSLGPLISQEGQTFPVTVSVGRFCGTQGPVTARIRIVNSELCPLGIPGSTNAVQGLDYVLSTNELNWAGGDNNVKSFTITILQDNRVELEESIALEITATGGAVAGTQPETLIVKIQDDDRPGGAADPTYNPQTFLNPTPGANNTVYSIDYLFNGRALIGGDFTGVNAMVRNGVARLNSNGSVDTAFNPGAGADGFVSQVLEDSDGKVLVVGGFTSFDNVGRHGIARLNDDGSLDATFVPGVGVDGVVMSVALQSDGKIIIVGDFTSFNNVPRRNVARLNTDGSLDAEFNPGSGADDIIYSVAVQSDDKVLLGGIFNSINGIQRSSVARLNTDGSVDTTFAPVIGADNAVYVIKAMNAGAMIGGAFSNYDGIPRNSIARLTLSGALDAAFDPGVGFNGPVYAIAFESDGQPVIGGEFTSYNGTPRTNLARVYSNGTVDTTFLDNYYTQMPGPDQFVAAVAVQSNGDILIGGGFASVGSGSSSIPRLHIARVKGGITEPTGNAPGNLEFTSTGFSIDENVLGGVMTITARRVNGTLGKVQVNYTTVDGSAKAGTDYVAQSGTLVWDEDYCSVQGGGEVKLLTIPILDNSIVEGNKNFYLKLSNPVGLGVHATNQPALGFQHTAEVTIIDNDFNKGIIGFVSPVFSVNEQDGKATITLSRTNGTTGNVSVQYAASNGSAVAGTDYVGVTNTVTFFSGQTTKTFDISLINDTASEPEETVSLRLLGVNGGAALGASNATLLIFDNENGPGSLSFNTNSFVVNENDSTVTVTVRRTSGSVGTATATLRTVDLPLGPGAARAGVDYTAVTQNLVFAEGVTSQTVSIPILNDGFVEGNERISLVLTNVTGATTGFLTNSTLAIVDDDFYGTLSFSSGTYTANEASGASTITVTRSGGSAEEVSVELITVQISATEGTDYGATKTTLTFPDGVTSRTASIPVLNDGFLEQNETVRLVLSNYAKASPGLTNATLTIVDDEALAVPAGSVDTFFNPNPGANDFINTMALQADGNLVVAGKFTAFNGVPRTRIARVNTDGSLDSTFDPASGANDTIHSIALQSDERILVAGRFSTMGVRNRGGIARLTQTGSLDTSFNPGAGADNPVYSVAIQPDGKILIAGDFANYNGTPRNRIARLTTTGVLDGTFDPGNGADGSIYVVVPLNNGQVLIGGSFTNVDNTAISYIARLNANGTLDSTFSSGALLNGSVRAIAVQPNGKIVIGGSFTGAAGNYVSRLNADGTLDSSFNTGSGANNIVYSISLQPDGKILLGGEFTSVNGLPENRLVRLNTNGTLDTTINFGAGANGFIASVLVQPDEKIVIGGGFTEFNGFSRNYVARLIGGQDIGPGAIVFSASSYSIAENATNVTLTVLRNGGATGAVGFTVATTNGTADSLDFGSTNRIITMVDGQTLTNITISIVNDFIPEAPETFSVYLSNTSGGATLGNPSQALVTIADDDVSVGFSAVSYTANEGAVSGAATINVARLGSTNGIVTVSYATVTNTATSLLDYAPTNGILTFAPGQTNQTFTVPIVNDLLVEGNETLFLVLSNVSAGASIHRDSAVLTIIDNDFSPGTIAFSPGAYTVIEGSAYVTLTLVRTNGSSGIVSVDYRTTNVTAVAGLDYISATGNIAFADGETNRTFNIAILNDSKVEGNETFNVILSNPAGGAAIGGQPIALVSIEDDEFGPGSLDPNFNPGSGANNLVRTIAVQSDDKIVVGGAFTAFDGTNRNYITRLHANGSNDLTFNLGLGANAQVSCVGILPDGKIAVGGAFSNFNTVAMNRLAHLNADGTLSTAFNQPSGLNAAVNAMGVQPDGKVVVGGGFSLPTAGITRIRANGSADTGFAIAAGANAAVHAVVMMEDGKTVFGGDFTTVADYECTKVARLSADGSLDLSFTPPNIATGRVYAVVVQWDGKVIIGGDFNNVGGTNRAGLARLNVDGSLDTTFDPAPNATVYSLALQYDGKVLVGGDFTQIGGTNYNRVARLNLDGSIDTTFDTGSGADDTVYSIVFLRNGKILIGGDFTTVNGFLRNGVARLNGDEVRPRFVSREVLNDVIHLRVATQPGFTYVLEFNGDLGNIGGWIGVVTNTAPADPAFGGVLDFTDSATLNKGFYRVRQANP